MLRGAVAIAVGALLVSWAGLPHDASLRERMLPVRMEDGHILYVSPVEVTLADWAHCEKDTGCSYHPKATVTSPPRPVTGVNWFDVNEYLIWANARSGGGLRLPTQAEWRWLNRTLEKPKPPPLFTDPRLAWAATYGQEAGAAGPVQISGFFSTTADGVADLDGNVWEWTMSCGSPGFEGKDAGHCPAYDVEGGHEAVIPVFERNPAAGGCATGTPPTYLGFRLVADR